MKTLILTTIVALGIAGAANATNYGDGAKGGFAAAAESYSKTGGAAITGGIAAHGNKGFSSVQNFQGAANSSGASAGLKFTEIDGTKGRKITRDVDGIKVDLDLDTHSVSEQLSQTGVVDKGTGTAGVGGGFAKSGGFGHATGGFRGWGSASW